MPSFWRFATYMASSAASMSCSGEDPGQRVGGALRGGRRVVEPVDQEPAVGQPGERVVQRLVLLAPLVGDVTVDDDEPGRAGVLLRQHGDRGHDRQLRAVGPPLVQ